MRLSLLALVATVIVASARADERLEGIACRSVHLAYPGPEATAFANEIIHIYWATGLKSGKMSPDEDEFLSVSVDTFGNLVKKILKGKIKDSKTMIGLLACSELFGRKPRGA